MNAQQALKQTYEFSQIVMNSYLGDLSDDELFETPGPGCNHIAWQLGHLIGSECHLLNMVSAGSAPELPDGFAEAHNKETAGKESRDGFLTKSEYLALFEKIKVATFAALDKMSAEDLDAPGPEDMKNFCPTVGAVFSLIAIHVMMHVGQWVPIRRRLDKPVAM